MFQKVVAAWDYFKRLSGKSHGQIERFDIFGQRADRDAIDSGQRDFAQIIYRDAAGCFQFGPFTGVLYGSAQIVQIEIIKQYQFGTGIQSLIQLRQIFHFDLNGYARFGQAKCLFQHGPYTSGCGDVIFLDQYAIE